MTCRLPHHAELADDALVAGLAVEDADAATAFVRRFQAKVFGMALSVTRDPTLADDVAQEAFLRAWRSASTYDGVRGSVSAWLLTITRNVAIDAVRARRSTPADDDELDRLLQVDARRRARRRTSPAKRRRRGSRRRGCVGPAAHAAARAGPGGRAGRVRRLHGRGDRPARGHPARHGEDEDPHRAAPAAAGGARPHDRTWRTTVGDGRDEARDRDGPVDEHLGDDVVELVLGDVDGERAGADGRPRAALRDVPPASTTSWRRRSRTLLPAVPACSRRSGSTSGCWPGSAADAGAGRTVDRGGAGRGSPAPRPRCRPAVVPLGVWCGDTRSTTTPSPVTSPRCTWSTDGDGGRHGVDQRRRRRAGDGRGARRRARRRVVLLPDHVRRRHDDRLRGLAAGQRRLDRAAPGRQRHRRRAPSTSSPTAPRTSGRPPPSTTPS